MRANGQNGPPRWSDKIEMSAQEQRTRGRRSEGQVSDQMFYEGKSGLSGARPRSRTKLASKDQYLPREGHLS
jgi:hypothetical protein